MWFPGSTPHKDILENDNIGIFHVREPPAALASEYLYQCFR